MYAGLSTLPNSYSRFILSCMLTILHNTVQCCTILLTIPAVLYTFQFCKVFSNVFKRSVCRVCVRRVAGG